MLQHIASPLVPVEMKKLIAFDAIDITLNKRSVTIQWVANPVNDMFADCIISTILESETINPRIMPANVHMKMDRMHFKECVIEMLQDMFGEECVPKIFKGDKLHVTVDNKKANIDLLQLEVKCKEDAVFQQVVQTAIIRLYDALTPTSTYLKLPSENNSEEAVKIS